MATKTCREQISVACSKTTTINPRRSSAGIYWTCPACSEHIRNNPKVMHFTGPVKGTEEKRSLVRSLMRIHGGR